MESLDAKLTIAAVPTRSSFRYSFYFRRVTSEVTNAPIAGASRAENTTLIRGWRLKYLAYECHMRQL